MVLSIHLSDSLESMGVSDGASILSIENRDLVGLVELDPDAGLSITDDMEKRPACRK